MKSAPSIVPDDFRIDGHKTMWQDFEGVCLEFTCFRTQGKYSANRENTCGCWFSTRQLSFNSLNLLPGRGENEYMPKNLGGYGRPVLNTESNHLGAPMECAQPWLENGDNGQLYKEKQTSALSNSLGVHAIAPMVHSIGSTVSGWGTSLKNAGSS